MLKLPVRSGGSGWYISTMLQTAGIGGAFGNYSQLPHLENHTGSVSAYCIPTWMAIRGVTVLTCTPVLCAVKEVQEAICIPHLSRTVDLDREQRIERLLHSRKYLVLHPVKLHLHLLTCSLAFSSCPALGHSMVSAAHDLRSSSLGHNYFGSHRLTCLHRLRLIIMQ